ncbi:deoxyguanosinetriphosphate triphosphohydrolase [Nocardioides marmoriginsengisoli]|uniref:Deoxyguanosinetriphosphate triphosphohydrolase-like protein n=1 Tax=Nocardioides marmoriginsengisoli TaxID=661483 RepID=A0A3N0CKX8_9ACTN|nr:deoxyguanosinetriphosphate triphosphohydrolase [Nocardioides marmoriginsengisoli]RNL63676.1 deoxyguanosinetriphosphate triphosphohydrolase [Nocardioides marmoriginsengisoli]
MIWDDLYDDAARARLVEEPAKRVPAPVRTPFERDRARVVHSASLRRLAAKTQVLGPQADDFVRNRLTHSLEVAQVARDLAHPLGCHPDLAETAALAHDLGHPPFGHNGEQVLDRLAAECGGFEGNAQTLRILTRLEAKSVDANGRSIGLNLTRATLDACTKYPWPRPAGGGKFGAYADDQPVFGWMRQDAPEGRRCLEAEVMDFADDVAYSVHDLEDGIVGGHIDLAVLESRSELTGVWETVRDWYLPDAGDDRLAAALARVRAVGTWSDRGYDGTRAALSQLKNLTSDLIGVFCGSVHTATRARYGEEPLARYAASLVVPEKTGDEIAVLKGIAAHYVMRSPERRAVMERQRTLIEELFAALVASEGADLDPSLHEDYAAAADDAARIRVVVDQIASLTDASAVTWHQRLCRSS